MAYQNMKAEMKRHRVTQGQVAEYLGMSENNFGLKINERVSMTVDEAKAIQKKFFPLANLDYLLESDGNVPTDRERRLSSIDALHDIVEGEGLMDEGYARALDEMRREAEGSTAGKFE